MKLILGVTLLVIQLLSTRAQDLDDLPAEGPENVRGERDAGSFRCGSKRADRIITDISSRNVDNAVDKLKKLKGDVHGKVNCIIHTAYDHDVSNFNIILELLDANQDETTSLATYKALNNEMNDGKHNDRLMRLKVMKSFNSKKFDAAKDEVSRVKGQLHEVVRDVVKEDLKNAIVSKNTTTISTICTEIAEYHPEMFGEVMELVVADAFDDIDKQYLTNIFLKHDNISQSMRVYSALLNEFKRSNDFNHSVVVLLASGVSEAIDRLWDDQESREIGYRLRDLLPRSVERIAFGGPWVCIKNENGEFLYAASLHQHDEQRRTVFTYTPGYAVTQGKWIIERHGDVYQIKNRRNFTDSEYMLRSLIPTAEDDYSFVFTWIPGGTDDYAEHQFDWTFEPHGDDVYIMSKYRNEYLYASDDFPFDDYERRRVYSNRNHEKVPGRSLWQIVICPRAGEKS